MLRGCRWSSAEYPRKKICAAWLLGCGVAIYNIGCVEAKWFSAPGCFRAAPGSNPARQPSLSSAQENPEAGKQLCRFFPAQQQEIPAQQQEIPAQQKEISAQQQEILAQQQEITALQRRYQRSSRRYQRSSRRYQRSSRRYERSSRRVSPSPTMSDTSAAAGDTSAAAEDTSAAAGVSALHQRWVVLSTVSRL